MPDKQNPLGAVSLLASWIAASSIGWAAGLAVGTSLTLLATRVSWLNQDRFFVYATLISIGSTIGLAQWVVMRRYLPQPAGWVEATVIGYILCVIIMASSGLARFGVPGVWDDLLLLALLGTAVGIPQWRMLRPYYRKAGLWVLAIAAGFLCLMWTIVNPSHSLSDLVMRGTVTGTLAAVVPGATLVFLVRESLATVS